MEYKYDYKAGSFSERHNLYLSQGTIGLGTSLDLETEKKTMNFYNHELSYDAYFFSLHYMSNTL